MEDFAETGLGVDSNEEERYLSTRENLKKQYQIPITPGFFGKYSLEQLGLNGVSVMIIFPNGEINKGILKEGRVVEKPGIVKYVTFSENGDILFSLDVERLLHSNNHRQNGISLDRKVSNNPPSNSQCQLFLELDTVKDSREILSKYEFAANEEPGLMSSYYNTQLEEVLNRPNVAKIECSD